MKNKNWFEPKSKKKIFSLHKKYNALHFMYNPVFCKDNKFNFYGVFGIQNFNMGQILNNINSSICTYFELGQ